MDLVLWNPKRRGKKRHHYRGKRRAGAHRRRRRGLSGIVGRVRRSSGKRRRRHNPIGLGRRAGGIAGMIATPAIGAAGAIGADVLFAKVPFLANLSPTNQALAKAGVALGIGLGGRKFLGDKAAKIADGILTVELYNVGRTQLAARFPTLGLNPTVPAVAATAPATPVSGYTATNRFAGKIPPRGPLGAYTRVSRRAVGGPMRRPAGVGAYGGPLMFNQSSPGAMGTSGGDDN